MPTVGAEARPTIGPVPAGADRPLWSVMIPTYRASVLLENALRSVLDQGLGPDVMQIAVVDDCSPDREAERIVDRLAPGRVEFHRNATNLGLAGNWNGCIARARGRWLHLFHQDDLLFPGFYERLGRAERERPDAGAAFCRHIYMDVDGHWTRLSEIERREAGVLEGWVEKISRAQRIQCASIVVRREIYERLGGYRSDLSLALDWEMWVRIASRYPVWFEPRPLACWRTHEGNESSRLSRTGADVPDVFRAIGIIEGYLPESCRGSVGRDMLREFRDFKIGAATWLMFDGERVAALEQLRLACACDPAWRRSRSYWNFRKWAMKLWWNEKMSFASKGRGLTAATRPGGAAAPSGTTGNGR
jgi:glycosyltransferase involved in cell wall biosynthesis